MHTFHISRSLGYTALFSLAAFNSAQAACTANAAGQLTCVDGDTIAGQNINVTGVTAGSHGIYVNVTGAAASASIAVSDTTITNNVTTPGPNGAGNNTGINMQNPAGGTGSLTLTMTGNNAVITQRGTGILVNQRGTGNATATVSGNLSIHSVYSADIEGQDGFEVDARGGNATIDMSNASGTIAVEGGGNGILLRSWQLTPTSAGTVKGTIGSGMQITVNNTLGATCIGTDCGSNGIYTYADNGTASVELNTAASIQVNGSGVSANGILASAVNGSVTVANSGTINTQGTSVNGIVAFAVGGAVAVTNSGAIDTQGTSADGIQTYAAGGNVTVANAGSLTVEGSSSHGIHAYTTANASTAGNVNVNNSGLIQSGLNTSAVHNTDSDGIFALSTTAGAGATGNVTVTNTAGITAIGDASSGIYAYTGSTGAGAAGAVTVTNSGAISVNGAASDGINASSTVGTASAGAGNVSVNNSGVIQSGLGTPAANDASDGIRAYSTTAGAGATGNVSVTNRADIATYGNLSHGIQAYTQSTGTGAAGNVSIISTAGTITTSGDQSIGIYAALPLDPVTGAPVSGTMGAVTVNNNSDIITSGSTYAGGIYAKSLQSVMVINNGAITTNGGGTQDNGIDASTAGGGADGVVTVINTGAITTNAPGSAGIWAYSGDGDITVTNTGKIITNGAGGGPLAQSDGIHAESTGVGNVAVTSIGADITTAGGGSGNDGIAALTVGGTASISLRNGTVSVAGDAAGLMAKGGTSASITIDALSVVHGGTKGGVVTDGVAQSVNNAGVIDALNDQAIIGDASTDATINITNASTGVITGAVNAVSSVVAMTNDGVWNLRNLADTNGDGVRDTLAVSVSNLGVSGGNSITNNGLITLQGGAAATLNATGAYNTGYSANTMALNGPVQAQILGVQTFTNNGVINLQGNSGVGNVLVISGGATPGVSGGGVYVANAGSQLRLNTVINEGGPINSRSDMLVVDSTRLGTGATTIVINPVNTNGVLTTGNGIELVRVLDSTHSAAGVFQLPSRIAAGAYEYLLYQGGADAATAGDGNWYLRSDLMDAGPGPKPPGPGPSAPDYRQEVPVYMTAPALANWMGLAMLGTYHDRVGEDRPDQWDADESVQASAAGASGDNQAEKKPKAAWGRVIGVTGSLDNGDGGRNFSSGGPSYNYDISAIQLGVDLLRAKHDNNSRDIAGLYLGMMWGRADVNQVYSENRAGTVKMDGYTFGGYWTHKGPSEWYIDAVLQGTRYANAEARSVDTLLNQKISPNGWGVAASLEGGYPFALGKGWSLEPQAQLIYQRISLDGDSDMYGYVDFGNTATWYGRLGARLAKDWMNEEGKKATIWARANLWHSFGSNPDTAFSALNGMGNVSLTTDLGSTWGQLGLGIAGQVTKRLTIFATGDYSIPMDGGDGYALQGRIGLRYLF
ncbi:MAG: autotransporter outer membrane beta-barrel domain-containing protein [Betaproteobacteria bacterium]|nr:autotransporter outer membrane beta-barrel domain-containing protein [Betaproteobacteria bacterium]